MEITRCIHFLTEFFCHNIKPTLSMRSVVSLKASFSPNRVKSEARERNVEPSEHHEMTMNLLRRQTPV